jgi:hypothetical protein
MEEREINRMFVNAINVLVVNCGRYRDPNKIIPYMNIKVFSNLQLQKFEIINLHSITVVTRLVAADRYLLTTAHLECVPHWRLG